MNIRERPKGPPNMPLQLPALRAAAECRVVLT